MVDAEQFEIIEEGQNKIFVSIHQKSNLVECDRFFEDWLYDHKFDVVKVRLLTALIYLNVCGLHEYPYANFLYLYGQHLLNDAVASMEK